MRKLLPLVKIENQTAYLTDDINKYEVLLNNEEIEYYRNLLEEANNYDVVNDNDYKGIVYVVYDTETNELTDIDNESESELF